MNDRFQFMCDSRNNIHVKVPPGHLIGAFGWRKLCNIKKLIICLKYLDFLVNMIIYLSWSDIHQDIQTKPAHIS